MNSAARRTLGSVIAGSCIAMVLFLIMNALISGRHVHQVAQSVGQIVDLVRVQEEEEVQTKQRVRPKRPPPPDTPPPPPQLKVNAEVTNERMPFRVDLPRINVSSAAGGGPFIGAWDANDALVEGELVPIVRVNPQYPREALIDEIEGYVKFEVLIGTDGSVLDVRVTEAVPGRVFVRNALRAVQRWKFKPRVVDGVAVERWAKTSIVFELAD